MPAGSVRQEYGRRLAYSTPAAALKVVTSAGQLASCICEVHGSIRQAGSNHCMYLESRPSV